MKTKVKRVPKRGHYDKETIYRILDNSYYCHVGFIHENYPVVIPTAYGRLNDYIFIHGSSASRMMKNLQTGLEVCVTITKMTGFVMAKSMFHHSMNYESVVLFGRAEWVQGKDEKLLALKAFSDGIVPGRWNEARPPNDKELKGTMVLKLKIEEASAKIRDEGVKDDAIDAALDIWTGVIPIHEQFGEPILANDLKISDSVMQLMKA